MWHSRYHGQPWDLGVLRLSSNEWQIKQLHQPTFCYPRLRAIRLHCDSQFMVTVSHHQGQGRLPLWICLPEPALDCLHFYAHHWLAILLSTPENPAFLPAKALASQTETPDLWVFLDLKSPRQLSFQQKALRKWDLAPAIKLHSIMK